MFTENTCCSYIYTSKYNKLFYYIHYFMLQRNADDNDLFCIESKVNCNSDHDLSFCLKMNEFFCAQSNYWINADVIFGGYFVIKNSFLKLHGKSSLNIKLRFKLRIYDLSSIRQLIFFLPITFIVQNFDLISRKLLKIYSRSWILTKKNCGRINWGFEQDLNSFTLKEILS